MQKLFFLAKPRSCVDLNEMSVVSPCHQAAQRKQRKQCDYAETAGPVVGNGLSLLRRA